MDESAPADLRDQYEAVYRFVRRRAASAAEAEDVTQEVFLSAATALERRNLTAAPTLAWLYAVAQRRLVDAARRAARRAQAGDAPLALVAAPPSYGNEVAAALRKALEELSPLQRKTVSLKLFGGLSFAEIAGATRSSEGACRMRFVRGLAQLRDVLEQEGIEP